MTPTKELLEQGAKLGWEPEQWKSVIIDGLADSIKKGRYKLTYEIRGKGETLKYETPAKALQALDDRGGTLWKVWSGAPILDGKTIFEEEIK